MSILLVQNCIWLGEYLKVSPEMSILLYTFWAHSLMLVVSANTKPSMLKLSSLAEQSASPPITGTRLSFT